MNELPLYKKIVKTIDDYLVDDKKLDKDTYLMIVNEIIDGG